MPRALVILIGGVMFGAGLGLSGCANPVVINNFLDLASPDLDFTLIVLFATALVVTTITYQTVLRTRKSPILEPEFSLPTKTDIDRRLIGGALLFGLGWSLSGICVGPALSSFSAMPLVAVEYLGALTVGILLHDWIARPRSS